MERIEEYINGKLREYKIKVDVSSVVEELALSNKINEFMTPSSVYTVFLMHLGKDDEMYKSILNGEYLFDIEAGLNDRESLYCDRELKKKITKIYGERARYVYVSTSGSKHFIGIRLSDKGYEPIAGHGGPECAIPYFLLVDGLKEFGIGDFEWNEVIFGYRVTEDERSKYIEILEHVKKMRLPVQIIDSDAMHISTSVMNVHECYLHCGSYANWPEDEDALNCAKTALYCLIYKRSKYRSAIGYDYVLLKYRGSYFKFKIMIRRDIKAEFRVNARISEIISQESDIFKKNVRFVKAFLDCHGYFPVYFDDRLIELICLMVGKEISSFGRFFNEFLGYKIKLEGLTFNLETLKITENKNKRFEVVYQHDVVVVRTPPPKVIQRLNGLKKAVMAQKIELFDGNLRLQTNKLLQPFFKDYDFVLSLSERPGFSEVKDKAKQEFLFGVPLVEELLLPSLKSKGYFFYSSRHSVLMVKVNEEYSPEELLYFLLLRTGFRYFLRNF
ncbi:hypothetical protein EHEL_060930 [Encephalitozoon hellem ATCC 50504]|uniref:Uncharacterized protein n=1 Tax=Encephalitozoon hellem TaxID=27973 RepID=A0A9Q9F8A4_ENCHE|nr:uncharacterized protein EHEL_060930 [Encephalitozoon hellem ATCC 50504]AFM98464.1 hypothetical protein EHEL_060930 [Encephalitozoon hellem ATCC 50504]UTX43389.1 hypothetical protein GPU96_06g11380 [Encephalitozoon hellem]|eukprot:XP_003887445.1 hypothetical protein EHEL_060930 [Encephalitozoon hellem ATCC 50504]